MGFTKRKMMNKMWDFIVKHRKEITTLENQTVTFTRKKLKWVSEDYVSYQTYEENVKLKEAIQLIIDYLDIKYVDEDIKKTSAKLIKKGK